MLKQVGLFAGGWVAFSLGGVCQADILKDFEDESLDWFLADGGSSLAIVAGGVEGEGSHVVQVTQPTGGWRFTIKFAMNDPQYEAFTANSTLRIDIRAETGDVPSGSLQIGAILNRGTAPQWQDFGLKAVQLDGEWQTLEWSYGDGQRTDHGGYKEILFITNTPSGGATYYIDNIRVVPEPATLGLLGLGGLLLALRGRRGTD